MVSDQEIALGVETLLQQSDPTAVATLNGVVQQLEAKLGLDLSHKAGFIRDQISLLLCSHQTQTHHLTQNDRFILQQHHPQFTTHPHQHFPTHFAPQQHSHFHSNDLNFHQPPPPQVQTQQQQLPPQLAVTKGRVFSQNATTEGPKESAPVVTKRRGGPGGLNKVCSVSPALQVIVGEPALPRTEVGFHISHDVSLCYLDSSVNVSYEYVSDTIVKQLWAYIRKNSLQDPSNKRKIICDDALRLVFETDCTDMFKMNKLLSKHITAFEPSRESSQTKREQVDIESKTECAESSPNPVTISEALAKFLDAGGRVMLATEAERRVWEHIKVNHLEDPLNPMVVLCDAKLRELLGCESISVMGLCDSLLRHHLFEHS